MKSLFSLILSPNQQSSPVSGVLVASSVTPASLPRLRPENPLDALLDELQTFAKPPSESGSRRNSGDTAATTNPRKNSVSEMGTKSETANLAKSSSANLTTTKASTLPRPSSGTTSLAVIQLKEANKESLESEESSTPSVDDKQGSGFANTLGVGLLGTGVVRRLPSFPSSDSQPSPVKAPLPSFGASNTITTITKKREDRRSLDSISSLTAKPSPNPLPRQELFKLPPPPPPRTSSKSPTMSPAGPVNPIGFSSSFPRASSMPPRPSLSHSWHVPAGVVSSFVGGVPRNAEGRELYGPVLRQRPPLGRGSFSEDSTTSTTSGSSTTSSGKAGQLSSNGGSMDSANSQEGASGQPQQKRDRTPPQDKTNQSATSKTRQENLEKRHVELLRRQKQLQEQYQRLQTLQKTGGRLTPVNIDLKKTASDGNIAGRLGLSLPSSSKSSLPPTPQATLASDLNPISLSTSNIDAIPSARKSAGIVETEIL